MAEFEFRGTSRTGQAVTGVRVAPTREALESALRRESIMPLRIVRKGREIAIPKPKWGGKVNSQRAGGFHAAIFRDD